MRQHFALRQPEMGLKITAKDHPGVVPRMEATLMYLARKRKVGADRIYRSITWIST